MRFKDLGIAYQAIQKIGPEILFISKAEQEARFVALGLTDAQKGLALSMVATTAAEEGAAVGATGLGAAMRGLWMSIAPALPWIIGIGAAIGAIAIGIKAYRNAHPSLEMLQKDAEEAKNKFDEMQTKVNETKERIEELRELKAQGGISSAEQAELDHLESQNEQYERQLELLKQIAEYKQSKAEKKANEDAVNAFNRFINSDNQKLARQDSSHAPGMSRVMLESHKNGLGGLLNAIDDYNKARADYAQALSEFNDFVNDKNYDPERDAAKLSKYQERVDKADASVEAFKDEIAGYRETLVNLRGDMTDKNAIASVDSWLDKIDETLNSVDPEKSFESFQNKTSDFTKQQAKAFEKLRSETDLTADKVTKVASKFPEFAAWMSDNGWTAEDVATYINRMGTGATEAAESAVTDVVSAAKTALEKAKQGMSDLSTAMSESLSSTGMSADSIDKITTLYGSLEGFDSSKLFQKTTSGVHMNAEELAALNDEYVRLQKLGMDNKLESMKKQYADLGQEIKDMQNALVEESYIEERIGEYDALGSKIEAAEQLRAEYTALTSAYNQFLAAQSAGDRRDPFENTAGSFESVKKLIDQGWTTDPEVEKFLNLMYGKENRSGDNVSDFEKLYEKIEGADYSISDFFTKDADGNITSDGLFNFLDAVNQLDSSLVQVSEDGEYAFDFSGDNLQRVSDLTGLSVEAIQLLETAMQDAGFDVWFDSLLSDIDYVDRRAPEAAEHLKELGLVSENFEFNFDTYNVGSLTEQLDTVKEALKGIQDSDGKIDLSAPGAKDALIVVNKLASRIAELNFKKINIPVSVQDTEFGKDLVKLQNDIEQLNKVKAQIDVTVEVGGDPAKLEEERDALLVQISDNPITTELNLVTKDADSVLRSWESQTPTIQAQVSMTADTENVKVGALQGDVNYKANTSGISDKDAPTLHGTVNYAAKINSYSIPRTIYGGVVRYTRVNQHGTPFVDGTAYANGSVRGAKGVAFRSGDWGTKDSGVALGGELGAELLVRDGKWHLIGEDSAEFFQYKRGDIIFNADQTREIFEKGKITHGSKRGNALSDGTAFDSGSGGKRRTSLADINNSVSNVSATSKNAKGGVSLDSDKEKFDWIEILLERVDRKIKTLTNTAESAFLKLKTRLSSSRDAITQITKQIDNQQKAYTRYIAEANSINISSALKKSVRDGTIDISLYSNETANLIKQYQEWYEKAIDCQDAIDDLHESLAQLYQDQFEAVQSSYNNRLEDITHRMNMYDAALNAHQEAGYMASSEYYAELANIQRQNISVLNQELSDLNKYFKTAMDSGEIEEDSEAWYEMRHSIMEVEEAIADANKELVTYANTMREIEWSYFDYAQDRMSKLTDEAEFFIDLMSNSQLFSDDGRFNSNGMATLGMHAVNYDTYMQQADNYAKEMQKIEKELASDPYNTNLIERRDTLLQLQRDSILAAEQEKSAVASLVQEGFNKELDSLKELIDSYEEALDSAKDLYEYEKRVTEKTANIATIQKQLSAYANDTSEENRSRVQKLQKQLAEAEDDLRDTEYDKYVSDQKKMLDNLYEEYEDILNSRMDDVDALFNDMIATVNVNADTIKGAVDEAASKVGYTVSDGMKSIWDGFASVSIYGDLSNVNSYLATIQAGVIAMANANGANLSAATKQYATGGLVDYTGLAQVDGTPGKPELMLNARDTRNFLDLKDILRDAQYLDVLSRKPASFSSSGAPNSSGVTIGDINFNIDHVQDYNDFMRQAQSDPKFEKLIHLMTDYRYMGGSKLKKYSVNF